MGKKSQAVVLAARPEDAVSTEKALQWHREGHTYEQIAQRLELTPWEARELVMLAYQRQLSETAEELRAQSETRILDVIRRLNDDLRIAGTQAERNSIYALILKADGERRRLLGLDIPPGTPDVPASGGQRA